MSSLRACITIMPIYIKINIILCLPWESTHWAISFQMAVVHSGSHVIISFFVYYLKFDVTAVYLIPHLLVEVFRIGTTNARYIMEST
jgi:hypothetical protein